MTLKPHKSAKSCNQKNQRSQFAPKLFVLHLSTLYKSLIKMNFTHKISIAAIALLILSGGVSAQQVKKKPVAKKPAAAAATQQAPNNNLPRDPDVLVGKLPNGLTVYIRKNSEPKNRAVLYLVNKVGSVLEDDDQQGLAHFTEHMAFNGTRDFPKNDLCGLPPKIGRKIWRGFERLHFV